MNRLSEMMQRYEHFKTSSFDKLPINEDGESIESLYETDWARILLIRTADEPDLISVEVEISLPKRASKPESKLVIAVPRDSLKSMITHLEYLIKLEDFGFELGLVGEDCVWTASKSPAEMLDEKALKALIPP